MAPSSKAFGDALIEKYASAFPKAARSIAPTDPHEETHLRFLTSDFTIHIGPALGHTSPLPSPNMPGSGFLYTAR